MSLQNSIISDLQLASYEIIDSDPAEPEPSSNFFPTISSVIDSVVKLTIKTPAVPWKVKRYEAMISALHQALTANTPISASPLLQPCLEAITAPLRHDIERFTEESYLNTLRHRYTEGFLAQLRQAILHCESNPDALECNDVYSLCALLYTKLDLNECWQEIYKTFVDMGTEALAQTSQEIPPDFPLMTRNLNLRYEQLKAVPYATKSPICVQQIKNLNGHLNGFLSPFDPNMLPNPIHRIFTQTIGGSREVHALAFGSPTIEKGFGHISINPEFKGMLRHYQKHGLKHGFFNHQNLIPLLPCMGDETSRCQAIHQLTVGEFKGTLYVFTFSFNSPFYYQEGIDELLFEVFKTEFLRQLFDLPPEISGNNISPDIVSQLKLRQWTTALLNRIHEIILNNALFTLKPVRRFIIHLVYYHLALHLILELRLDSYNNSCKDCADRGICSNAIAFAYRMILNNQEEDEKVIDSFESLIFSRALILRKRPIIHSRLQEIIETVNFLIAHKSAIQALS